MTKHAYTAVHINKECHQLRHLGIKLIITFPVGYCIVTNEKCCYTQALFMNPLPSRHPFLALVNNARQGDLEERKPVRMLVFPGYTKITADKKAGIEEDESRFLCGGLVQEILWKGLCLSCFALLWILDK